MPQSPAEIQQQIEDARAELAHTIDAIAEIVSPKRAAKRGVAQLKLTFEEIKAKANPPAAILDTQTQRALPPGMSDKLHGSTLYGTKRTVRWDRVAMAAGGVAVLALIIRRRRNR